jgi:hypothetical protein
LKWCNALTSCPDLSHLVAKGLTIEHALDGFWKSNGYRACFDHH